jgi:hypothetical protein
MKPEHLKIHEQFLKLCQGYVKREAPIVVALQMVVETKLYKEFDMQSPYMYATEICGLSEGNAYVFIAVGKHAKLYPCLQDAIVTRTLTVPKANRILSIINAENAEELVAFAKTHTQKEIEREVRRRNPKAAARARIKPLSGDTDLLQIPIPRETTENISRAQTILARKTSKHQGLPETITLVFKDYVERHDPLKRAQRAEQRRNSAHAEKADKTRTSENSDSRKTPNATHGEPRFSTRAEIPKIHIRTRFTAAEIHAIDLRDERKCTHIGRDGKRCNSGRWIRYHHIIHVAHGGSNHPDNVATLCSFHHDLVHQQVFPLDGERSWLRSPERAYMV